TVLREAFVDLARLLVGVDVEGQVFTLRIPPDLLEPLRRARADGVGSEPDGDAPSSQVLDTLEVLGDGRLPEAVEASSLVRRVEDEQLDAGLACCVLGGQRFRMSQIVKLTDGRVSGRAHLA